MQDTIEISNVHPYERSHTADSQPKNGMPTPARHPQARDRAYTTKRYQKYGLNATATPIK
jgi:hypothetical protein